MFHDVCVPVFLYYYSENYLILRSIEYVLPSFMFDSNQCERLIFKQEKYHTYLSMSHLRNIYDLSYSLCTEFHALLLNTVISHSGFSTIADGWENVWQRSNTSG